LLLRLALLPHRCRSGVSSLFRNRPSIGGIHAYDLNVVPRLDYAAIPTIQVDQCSVLTHLVKLKAK
jgi:hypothetical protein